MADNRFVNNTLSELQEANRSPIFGYEDSPLLTLEEAVEKITPSIDRAMDYVATAKKKYNRHSTLLTRDESAAIYLYSMPTSFFSSLNTSLRAENRDALKPWFAFLKLFITALEKLPSTKLTVWRGVNYDDTLTFVDDDVHIWWSVNSCSMNPNSVQPFLGENGTLFAIDAIHGKDISAFSAIPDEQEIVFMPGTRVRRRYETLNFNDRLFVLHLEQINSQSESQPESNYLFEQIRQEYQRNNRLHRIMNPAKSFPIEQSYINLAIVTAKEQREKEKQLHDTQHSDNIMGSFEEIYGMKTAIEVKDIFQSCKSSEKRVLVFGRAGIGKSTFCRYVAYQWARGSYWSQYDLLALIPLRRLTTNRYPPLPTGQNYSLIDLIKKEVFSYDLSEKEETLLQNQFDAKKTLWILDGYDEIVQNVPSHLECLFEQLLKTPHHILTLRPYLNTLSYNVQMEITGFTDTNIGEYVQQFFNQMKDELDDASIKSQKLFSFLKSNASIWGVAHIPVNLELICSLWSNEDLSETKDLTITTLYSMMTEWLCRRYLASQNNQTQRLSEDEVYRRCQKELIFLESLAFNAMESNTIIIRPPLLKKSLDEAEVSLQDHPHLLNIGILKSFNKQGIGTQIETHKDHYFVHLSFQEYFAARYLIITLNGFPNEKAIEFIKHQKYNQRYALLFTFASGLLGENDPKPCLNIYWDTILGEPLDLVGIRHMQLVISCLEETSNKITVPRYTELLEWIAKYIKYGIFSGSKNHLPHLLESLQRAQTIVCDKTITNMLINILRYEDITKKTEALSFICQLTISNPSPALITSITTSLDDKNEGVRMSACSALGSMSEKAATKEVISKLVSALADASDHVRWGACYALGKVGENAATNEVIMKLVSSLGDESHHVRESARDALRNMTEKTPTKEVISNLLSALGDESDYVRVSACSALEKMGEKAVTNEVISKLVSALGDANDHVRWSACNALGKMGEKTATNEVISKLVGTLGDESHFVRGSARDALRNMAEKTATNEIISKLVSALEDESDDVRVSACSALGEMGEKAATSEVISKLLSALGDERDDVRGSVCSALGEMGEKAVTNEVISKLVGALEDESDHVRWSACDALGKIGEKAATHEVVSKIVSALGDESHLVRGSACDFHRNVSEKTVTNEVIGKLVSALGDERDHVRVSACSALGEMGEKAATNEVISKLVGALGDKHFRVRVGACKALGKMGEKAATNEVISKLVSALGDESDDIRWSAYSALEKMGEKVATNEVISKLVSALGDERDHVRWGACYALGRMGENAATNEVISKLVAALGDEREYVRESACKALENMGEKAATHEVLNKLLSLIVGDSFSVLSNAANAIRNIFSSSALVSHLDPKVVAELCLSKYGSNCLTNISVDQLIDIYFASKNPDWLSAITQLSLLQETAVMFRKDKVVVYGRKEPVELPVPSVELCEQLIQAFTDQAKRLYLSFEVLPEVANEPSVCCRFCHIM